MARVVVDRTWRETPPDGIEAALADLRREVGMRLPSARAVMSNLVVVRACASDDAFDDLRVRADLPLDEVVARHPSRVIVIAHEHGCAAAREPVAARVAVSTFGPPSARYSVEEIAVRSACAEASLASIVRRLLRGDVPTSVWWTDDFSDTMPLRSILDSARQLIYDSRQWKDIPRALRSLRGIVATRRLDFADLNWRRLAPVRRALGRLHGRAPDARISYRRNEAPLAWLAAGWLQRDIGRLEEHAAADEVLRVVVGSPATTVVLTDERLTVEPHDAPAYTVGVRRETDAEAIAAELRTLARDAPLAETLAWLTRTIE